MNLYQMRREFDNMLRSQGLSDFEALRDAWLNQGWQKISESFRIPSLERHITFDCQSGQDHYSFPYDYNGTETAIMYNLRRLDPVSEDILKLRYEMRQPTAMGPVRYYDWHGTWETDLLVVENVTLANKSDTVLTTSVDTLLNQDYFVRFDPYLDATNPEADVNEYVDPGEWGHRISAGSLVPGVSFQLTLPYKGPSGDKFTMRVRPAETQKFTVYGTPQEDTTNAFEIAYATKPRRLYNNEDVPEWPNMGLSIVYMATSMAFEWHHNMDLSSSFWGRAMNTVKNLEKRKNLIQTRVTDITMGSATGRKTGIYGTMSRRYR